LCRFKASGYAGKIAQVCSEIPDEVDPMQDAASFKIGFRVWLMLLSAFASLPMILFSVISLFFLLESQRNAEKEHLTRMAVTLSRDLDRQLSARAAMLLAVADGDAARNGDLAAFYGHAARIVASASGFSAIALVSGEGKILFNTTRRYGEPLPDTNDPASARRVIETGHPQVSAAFEGSISHQRVTSLGVRVLVGGQTQYCLRGIMPVSDLEAVVAQQYLPEGWSAAVLEGNTPVVALGPFFSLDSSQEAGKVSSDTQAWPLAKQKGEGKLVETAVIAVGTWNWRVAVSVPESAFVRPLRLTLLRFGAAGVVCLLAGILASHWLAERLSRDISGLASAALSTDHPHSDEGTIIREMGEVRACLLAARDREEQALTDPLTGLPGRARFWELAGELERISRSDMELGLAVMFIDLDGFKLINDQHGHAQGDWILQRVGDVMRESVRDVDVVGRLGGDEFAVCLTARRGCLVPSATAIADRMVRQVREIGFGIGCSIGISVCEICSPDLSRALTLADRAMYEAKRLGKNRYVIREDTTA
jgi:diguanylate cyclase (GGDEF)-like protein